MAEPAIVVDNLSKRFRVYHQRNATLKQTLTSARRARYDEFWALRDVSFEVARGSTLGIIGENGSGKSTALKCIAGILKPDGGTVTADGRLAAMLELGAGFHPEYSGRENVYLNGALLGLPRSYIDGVFDDIMDFAGEQVSRALDNAVKTYSSGMYARLGFSIAVHMEPDILVVDEILAVGDESFQRRCYDRLAQMKAQGKTMVIVSHALEAIREVCTDVVWLDHGRLRAEGSASEVIAQYLAEVDARESTVMQREVEKVHELVASGRGNVGVTRVTFVADGAPRQVVQTGSDFEMRIEYHSPGPLKGARFTVSLVREDGVEVLRVQTDDEEMAGVALPPKGTVTLRIPRLPLLEGLFRAGVTITEIATEEPYTILDRAFPFRVRTLDRREAGVALLGHSWSLPAEEIAPVTLQTTEA